MLRRKSNSRGSEVENQKVKVEFPEKSEEAKRPQDPGINSNPSHPAGGEKRRVAHPFQNRTGKLPKRFLRIECATRPHFIFSECFASSRDQLKCPCYLSILARVSHWPQLRNMWLGAQAG